MPITDCMVSLLLFFGVAFFAAAPVSLALNFTLAIRKVRFDS